jgi:hypothetical protein
MSSFGFPDLLGYTVIFELHVMWVSATFRTLFCCCTIALMLKLKRKTRLCTTAGQTKGFDASLCTGWISISDENVQRLLMQFL